VCRSISTTASNAFSTVRLLVDVRNARFALVTSASSTRMEINIFAIAFSNV
jgi:hypothetical protein